jgi:hypothetical protein
MEGSLRPSKGSLTKIWDSLGSCLGVPYFCIALILGLYPSLYCAFTLVNKLKLWNYDAGAPDAKGERGKERKKKTYEVVDAL